ncbi:hypothetical protein V1525DRAFT_435275 [Lipomyces kononenkoae]|uniref:Uncharacterized protein n=1 Tax=Lipomyces kononenkoae TaxID=34357 RepID=A0ACC3SVI6_LIPKO
MPQDPRMLTIKIKEIAYVIVILGQHLLRLLSFDNTSKLRRSSVLHPFPDSHVLEPLSAKAIMSPPMADFARLRNPGYCRGASPAMPVAAISGRLSPHLQLLALTAVSRKLEPLAAVGLMPLVILLPNLSLNATAYTNSTSNSTLPTTNTSSTTPETFAQNLSGFSSPNSVANFYFIFLILLAVVGYFAFRYFRKRQRARRLRALHARRTQALQALRQDIETAGASTQPGSHYLFSDGANEDRHMSQVQRPFSSIFGNSTWRSSSPPPPPPYVPGNGGTVRPDTAYLGGAALPIYEDVILEEEEDDDDDDDDVENHGSDREELRSGSGSQTGAANNESGSRRIMRIIR